MEKIWIRDGKKLESGIRDKHPGSATLGDNVDVHGTFFRIDKVVAVSSTKLFLNWTVEDWNRPVTGYSLSYREEGDDSWRYHQVRIVNYGAARRSSEGCGVA
jgi:hypothetical protein